MTNTKTDNLVTIVIVIYKEPFDLIKKTLEKIVNFNKIIIDNSGNEIMEKKIKAEFSIDTYIINKKNNGFSAGYNQGIKMCNSELTMVLGPDCVILERYINLLKEKLRIYKNALIVSPTAYDEEKNLTYAGGPLFEFDEKQTILNISGDTCVNSTLGACMLFRTKDIINYNLYFDENFFLYFSDYDLCRRIRKLNKSIIQVFDAKCTHKHGNLKINNTYLKIFIREYNFFFDQLYYFYKDNIHHNLISTFEKKLPKLFFRILIKIILFKFKDATKNFSRILAYYKFKRRFLRRDGRAV